MSYPNLLYSENPHDFATLPFNLPVNKLFFVVNRDSEQRLWHKYQH